LNKRKLAKLSQKKFIEKIEQSNIPLYKLAIVFLLIISIRFLIEGFSTKAPIDFLHIFSFYLSLLLSLGIILSFSTKTKFRKIANILVPAFTITIFPPLFDLFLSGGNGFKMLYLQPQTFSELLFYFLTLGGEISKGVSPGIKIEIILATIAIFYYIHKKTSSKKDAFLGAIASYTTIYFYGISPVILNLILKPMKINLLQNWEFLLTTYFFVLITLQLALIFYLNKKK
jgi:hypothetical protein